jgi:hypothetical protein
MAVSAVTSAVVLYTVPGTSGNLDPAADRCILVQTSRPPVCTTAAREHAYLQLSMDLYTVVYQCRTRMLVRETLQFRHCKAT